MSVSPASGSCNPAQALRNGKAKLTVAELATAKRLAIEFLRDKIGLRDGVEIPYYDPSGNEVAVKRRSAINAKDGSYWPKGVLLLAYGAERLESARQARLLILVEGESDCWALWFHEMPALGIPGANAVKVLTEEHLEGIETLYVHREPDRGGSQFIEGVKARLDALGFRGRAFELRLSSGVKDPADLHCAAPDAFLDRLRDAIETAAPIPLHPRGDAWEGDHGAVDLPEAPGWQPFPTDLLPEPIRSYTTAAAAAVGCDSAFVALPLLTAIGAAIGNTRRLVLRPDWTEPPILWTVIVGESGTQKSPAFDLATAFIRDRQALAFANHRRALANWKKANDAGEHPDKPDPPERFLVSDVTLEALACRLKDAPRGLLLARDELAGWLRSFDQYRKGKGGDLAHYLSLHRAGSLTLDRKTGDQETIHVPRAFLAVAGGVQPGVLRRALTPEFFEAGLTARLLVAMPPRRRRRWSEVEIDPDTRQATGRVFERLWALTPETPITVRGLRGTPSAGNDDEQWPTLVNLTADGKAAFVRFFDAHADEQFERTGNLAAAWSKLEGYCGRLALILHLCRWADGDPSADPLRIDAASVGAAVQLVRWFGRETERVYAVLSETEREEGGRQLMEWIRGQGGNATVREVQRAFPRRYPTADAVEAALNLLTRLGGLEPETAPPGPHGGHPTTRYHVRGQR